MLILYGRLLVFAGGNVCHKGTREIRCNGGYSRLFWKPCLAGSCSFSWFDLRFITMHKNHHLCHSCDDFNSLAGDSSVFRDYSRTLIPFNLLMSMVVMRVLGYTLFLCNIIGMIDCIPKGRCYIHSLIGSAHAKCALEFHHSQKAPKFQMTRPFFPLWKFWMYVVISISMRGFIHWVPVKSVL